MMAIFGFGGDRLTSTAYFAVALEAGVPVGLASLAPTDEEGQGGPHIIAVWVVAELVRSAGAALLRALVEESQRRYGVAPTLVAVAPEEAEVAREALRQGVALALNDQSRLMGGRL
ncbi:MAG TPA: hypothetical protein VFS21_15195 [Roseiflexaceae bacterium]|nr:hypothetical protein [Roseiflexaceae bacterium]